MVRWLFAYGRCWCPYDSRMDTALWYLVLGVCGLAALTVGALAVYVVVVLALAPVTLVGATVIASCAEVITRVRGLIDGWRRRKEGAASSTGH